MVKNDFIETVYCKELDTRIKGFMSIKNIKLIKENCSEGFVMQGMEYRPDKIAAYYLGDERLGWLIDIANGFADGIKSYYLGRKLNIPNDLDGLFSRMSS